MKSLSLKWRFELLSWIFSLLLLTLILLPFITNAIQHPFLIYNCIFVLVFIHFTKYIFLLKHSPLGYTLIVKLFIIFASIPVIVLLMDGMSMFQKYYDEVGLQTLVNHLNMSKQNILTKYIQIEMIFFAVASIIVSVLLPIRMIVSIWRVKNLKNKV